MSAPRRGLWPALITCFLVAVMAALVSLHGRELAAEYHLLRLRADPARLLGLLEAEEGSARGLAVQRFLRTPQGGTAVLDTWFELLERLLGQDLANHIAGASTVHSALEGALVSLSCSSFSRSPKYLSHRAQPAGAIDASLSRVWQRLVQLQGHDLCSEKFPRLRFAVLPSDLGARLLLKVNVGWEWEVVKTPVGREGSPGGPVLWGGRLIEASVPDLAKALDDQDPEVRLEAAFNLLLLGPRAGAAIPALTRALREHESRLAGVAWLSSEALRRLGSSALPSLLGLLEDGDPQVRRLATRTIAGSPGMAGEAVPRLILLLDHERGEVRAEAVNALSQLGQNARPAISALKKALSDRDEWVRLYAEHLLKKLGVL